MKHPILLLFSLAALHAGDSLSLHGEWKLALDPSDAGLAAGPETWHFPDRIQLPGSTAGQRKGPAAVIEPKLDRETMNHLRERHPFVGPAWYQREVSIPAGWKDHDVQLVLERVLWESRVWVDQTPVGDPQNSLSVPHRHDLSAHLTPGKTHLITLRIDNREMVPIGSIGHAYTPATQSLWNGVIGRIALEALPASRIESARIVTREDGHLRVEARGRFRPGQKILARIDGKAVAEVAASGSTATLEGRAAGIRPWSESAPHLHELTLQLLGTGGKEHHVLERRIGFRSFRAEGRNLLVNGRPTFLRGNLECAIFPQTGHPDAEGPQWEKIMRTSRAYGLNHLRFHSWCPPAAAFEAADRHGMYLQVELPNWTFEMGRRPVVDAFLLAEGERILREYSHHPSFVMFSLGNELAGELDAMDRMVEHFQSLAPEILHTSTSFAFSPRGKLPGPADDFFISQQTESGWVRGQGFLNSTFPSTDTDYAEGLACLSIPLITHEVGQYVVYPNVAELPKYENTPLRSTALEAIRDDLTRKGRLDEAARYTRDSGKLAALLYKEDIERALRTEGLAGIQLLQLQDFPGQSTATVGLLDAFWDSKGLIEPERFRDFCAPVVPLARMPSFVWRNDATFHAELELAQFSGEILHSAFHARLVDADGVVHARREFPARDYPLGNRHSIGRFEASLASWTEATRLDLIVESADGRHRNSWPLWVYPREVPAAPAGVVEHTLVSDACLADLAAGKTVLLLPHAGTLRKPLQARFIPVFWSPLHFPNQPGTLGATIDPGHPLWQRFPTDSHTDWQWWELTANSVAVDLDGADPAISKPFRFVDKYDRNALPTAIFETAVGPGKLLVCTLDVRSEPDQRFVARHLLHALREHAASPAFQPAGSMTPAQLRELFREASILASASSAHPDYPALLATDGDPATLWHTDWRDEGARFPFFLTLDLQQSVPLAGLRLANRADNRNGRIRRARLEISEDGTRWKAHGPEIELPDGAGAIDARLAEPLRVRHVRVVALSSHHGGAMASLAEISPLPADAGDVRDLGIIPGFND